VCDRFEEIGEIVRDSFNVAAEEPKITSRDEMLERVSQPMVSVPQLTPEKLVCDVRLQPELSKGKREKREVMRKHMVSLNQCQILTNL